MSHLSEMKKKKSNRSVVMKMGILAHSSNFQNCIKKTNKIPEYARDFKNKWLFIIGINKLFYKFEDKSEKYEREIYNSIYCNNIKYFMKRFLKYQERGYIKDTSNFVFKKIDVFSIKDTCSMLIYENEMYNKDEMYKYEFYQGFKDFYNLFCKFYDKINIDEDDYFIKTIENYIDPRNNVIGYDFDSDSDDLDDILPDID